MLKKIVFAAVFSILLLMLNVGHAHASYPLRPLLKVSTHTLEKGKSFTASIWLMEEDYAGVDGYWDISGLDLLVYFDHSFINAVKVKIDPDGWWSSFWPGGTFIVLNKTDNIAGTVRAAFLGLSSVEGFHQPPNGIGRLFSIDFVAVATNITPQTGTEIALGKDPYALAGFPHPERSFPPWNASIEIPIPYVVENSTYYFNPKGDVNFDGTVNIQDVVLMSSMYGCKEGELDWHVSADIAAPYGKVDILDLVTCTGHYGEKYP